MCQVSTAICDVMGTSQQIINMFIHCSWCNEHFSIKVLQHIRVRPWYCLSALFYLHASIFLVVHARFTYFRNLLTLTNVRTDRHRESLTNQRTDRLTEKLAD